MSPERKIGYSFLSLLAGDGALLAYFVWSIKVWEHDHWQLLGFFYVYVICSFIGWIVAGLPAVLLMNVSFIGRLRWPVVLLIGAALGAMIPFLAFLVVGLRRHLNVALQHGIDFGWYWAKAMLVSRVAFAVYCFLARREIKRRTIMVRRNL